MQPDPEDHYIEDSRPSGPPMGFIIAGVVVVVALALWFFTSGESEPPAAEPPPVVASEPEMEPEQPPTPDIPELELAPAPETGPNEPAVSAEPPVTLETSDTKLRERLGEAGDSDLLKNALVNDNLVERGTAVVDSLSRGIVLSKLLPVAPPKGKFTVLETDGQLTINPASYQRYDAYAEAIEELDTATLVETFHRFRPLLEEAYAGLGYEAEDFDNAVIRALDLILATPRINEPVAVVKSEAIYKHVDPELEQRPALQKQLLRMGSENVVRVQKQARALRSALLVVQA